VPGLLESQLRAGENLPRQPLRLVEDSQEQMLRFDDAAAQVRGFVSREKNDYFLAKK